MILQERDATARKNRDKEMKEAAEKEEERRRVLEAKLARERCNSPCVYAYMFATNLVRPHEYCQAKEGRMGGRAPGTGVIFFFIVFPISCVYHTLL